MKQQTNPHLQAVREKYDKLNSRLQRSLKEGRFLRFSIDKKRRLFQSLSRYEKQLRQWGIAVATGVAMLLPGADALAQVTPVGSEFRVNTWTTSLQVRGVTAMDSDGDFVITWDSYGQDGSQFGIYAQRYNNSGVAQGSEFRVNTYTTGNQFVPAISTDSDGDFVITWSSTGQDGNASGIYAQRYNNMGVAQGSEFRVNTYTTGNQNNPAISMDSDGDFVVTWQSYGQDGSNFGVYAKRYNNLGVAQGSEFRVNTFTTGYQNNPAISMDSDGDFVITWQSKGQDGSQYGIYAQRYNSSGVAQGIEFKVNTYTTNYQKNPAISMDSDGDFVITWESNGQDGNGYGVYSQRYNNSGVAQGSEFRVNTYTTLAQNAPVISMDSDGDFVVTWTSNGQDGSSYGIYAKRYNNMGVAQGSEFRVNTYTYNLQSGPAISMDSDGDFVVTWESYGQDGSNRGVYAQRYATPCTPINWYADTDGDGYGIGTAISACIQPANSSANNTDCDDAVGAINPGATEIPADGIDQDCNSQELCYKDADNDGYRPDAGSTVTSVDLDCADANEAIASDPTNDCDDNAAAFNPGAQEICNNGIDDDCDGFADDADPSVTGQATWYQDNDNDGLGNAGIFLPGCVQPVGYVADSLDCNDNSTVSSCDSPTGPTTSSLTDVSVTLGWNVVAGAERYNLDIKLATVPTYPPAIKVYTNSFTMTGLVPGTKYNWRVRANCDTLCSMNSANLQGGSFRTNYRGYPDTDGDGYGDETQPYVLLVSFPAVGYSLNNTDCNDASSAVNPGVTEICNGVDDDCDISIDEGTNATTWYEDADGDGLGNVEVSQMGCIQPTGYVTNSLDCNDGSNIPVCAVPTDITVEVMAPDFAVIFWGPAPCVSVYKLQYKKSTDSGWTNLPSLYSNSYPLEGLMPGSLYQYRLRSRCTATTPATSSAWVTGTFMTPSLPMGLVVTGDQHQGNIIDPENMSIEVYPNPGDGIFNIILNSDTDREANLKLTDNLGKLILEEQWQLAKGETIRSLDMSYLPVGIYQIQVLRGDLMLTKKIVLMK